MPSRKDVLLQLATGLEYIHKEKVIHLDITPKNIVIWVNPEHENVLLKWTDFGLSKQLKETGSYTLTKIRGTEGWLSPEILKILDNQQQTSRTEAKQRGTVKSDVFNEGLVFGYYLLNGLHLFAGLVESNIYYNKPVNLDKIQWQSARDLIKKMIHPDPGIRISSSDVAKEVSQIKSDLG
ncbi:serine/threonine-protein kinase/endoribonuclease IRE1-like [Daphnia pulicaria]|uniref:serine/threonine-protein kinase/endoribonuclease IRE1-like n=1 Tax=Daphnia pulicaria TaxID=35523 RepID=UPI001EEB58B1|nr:serine/threonine-protein kinase/endoribonuclease IRE1-like [Daphnia pulicaria]